MSNETTNTVVAIVYFSASGRTAALGEAIAKGASSIQGVTAQTYAIQGDKILNGHYVDPDLMTALDQADAIIFGTPTYMAGPAGIFKMFVDATVGAWTAQKWKDKVAAAFTVSGTPSGDKLATLQYLQGLAMQHGMVWVGLGEPPMQPDGINRLGSWIGVMAQTQAPGVPGLSDEDLRTGERLGQRVAKWTRVSRTIFNENK